MLPSRRDRAKGARLGVSLCEVAASEIPKASKSWIELIGAPRGHCIALKTLPGL